MSFDLDAALRQLKPQSRKGPIARRSQLRWARSEPAAGTQLMLDTTVYLDLLQGKTPPEVDALLLSRIPNHTSVAVAELTHSFGRLNPAHPQTKRTLKQLQGIIADIPPHRLSEPDDDCWGKAGIAAGLMARLLNVPNAQRDITKFLNDALIYLQAAKLGAAVLTRNHRDFDLLEQLVPVGAVIYY